MRPKRNATLLYRPSAVAEDRERLVQDYVFAAHVRQAKQFWDHADIQAMRDLLSPYSAAGNAGRRDFTWRYLWRLSHADRRTLSAHTDDVYFAVYSPDGKTLATAGKDHTLRLWDAATGRACAVSSRAR